MLYIMNKSLSSTYASDPAVSRPNSSPKVREAAHPAPWRLLPKLSAAAWALLGGDLLYWLGIGLFVPYFVVYLHQVRGMDLAVSGFIMAAGSAAGFVSAPLAGFLNDRFHPRGTLTAALCLAIAGACLLPFIQSPWQAFGAAILLLGCGQSVIAPSVAALLAAATTDGQRTIAFTIRYSCVNIGFGSGAAIAGMIVQVDRPGSFLAIFLAQALLCGIFILILHLLPKGAFALQAPSSAPQNAQPRRAAGVAHLLQDGRFWTLWLTALLFYTMGVGQLANGFTVYATQWGQIRPQALGLALGLNSLSIVLLQFPVLRWLAGRLRTRALALLFLIWIGAWISVALAGQQDSTLSPALLFGLAAALFGSGETLMAPTLFPLVISLAPHGMQGRYTAAISLASTTGFVLAPLLSGLLLGAGDARLFLATMLGGCALGTALALHLERRLPSSINRIFSSGIQ